jgi:hypothetical protein
MYRLWSNMPDLYVVLHCTHGFNRTGALGMLHARHVQNQAPALLMRYTGIVALQLHKLVSHP